MRFTEASERAVTVRLSEGESVTPREAEGLIRRALREAGLQPWASVESEIFEAGGQTLLIARPGRRLAVYFPGLEELLAGARACADAPSALYLGPDGYLLTLPPAAARPGLYTYGQLRPWPAGWECRAAQRGLLLLTKHALPVLHSYFTT